MTIGRTNSGSGGGGISSNAALLVVYAPLGSIVTATKDGVTKTSRSGIALSDRPTVEIHLFSIGSSQFGTWAVTATRETDTNTTTISISAVERYELYIGYHVPLQTYQEVEYLQSSGATQLINTNFTAPDSIEIQFQYGQLYSGQNMRSIAGCRTSNAANKFSITHWNGNFSIAPPNSNGYSTPVDTNKHIVQNGAYFNNHTFFDGNDVKSYSAVTPPNLTLYLFQEHQDGYTNTGNSNCKIYYVKLWKNGTLGREMYPCYRLSDSVAGMYDKANDVFYTNSGSGTFVVGEDV